MGLSDFRAWAATVQPCWMKALTNFDPHVPGPTTPILKFLIGSYHLASGAVAVPTFVTTNPMRGPAHSAIEIPEGVAIVEHSIFQGKDAGIRIYVNPANMGKFLPEAHGEKGELPRHFYPERR
jgi:hypothetical protein